MSINRPQFFDVVREDVTGGKLSQEQVDGMTAILEDWEKDHSKSDDRCLAYMLGTASHVTEARYIPVVTPVGEPAEEALKPTSELFQHLKGLRPDGTTVTIWTYPGNYDRLRHLKQTIRQVGFQVAVRPLPKGVYLGASSQGSKTLSE